jgi:hypothetical protein
MCTVVVALLPSESLVLITATLNSPICTPLQSNEFKLFCGVFGPTSRLLPNKVPAAAPRDPSTISTTQKNRYLSNWEFFSMQKQLIPIRDLRDVAIC